MMSPTFCSSSAFPHDSVSISNGFRKLLKAASIPARALPLISPKSSDESPALTVADKRDASRRISWGAVMTGKSAVVSFAETDIIISQ